MFQNLVLQLVAPVALEALAKEITMQVFITLMVEPNDETADPETWEWVGPNGERCLVVDSAAPYMAGEVQQDQRVLH